MRFAGGRAWWAAFPDGRSALMLVAARLRHIAGTRWGTKRYLDMERLREQEQEEPLVADRSDRVNFAVLP